MTPPRAPTAAGARCIHVIDAHTAGEPLRVVVDGFPEPIGPSMLAKRRWLQQNHDPLRRTLMLEPRGHADMYGCVLTQPVTDDGDVGVLFLHNEGYSTMCGHGIIGLVKVGLDCQLFCPRDPSVVRIDTPAGRVTAWPEREAGAVASVRFENVPSFVHTRDYQLVLEASSGAFVRTDVAFGGAFYALVDADDLELELEPGTVGRAITLGRTIKGAVSSSLVLGHPDGDRDLAFLYGTIFVGPARAEGAHSRNVCIFADGQVDRSPTGTGVSARVALLRARGEVELGQWIRIESILGTTFDVRAARDVLIGERRGVVPEVRGSAWITGASQLVIDPLDPLAFGFSLR